MQRPVENPSLVHSALQSAVDNLKHCLRTRHSITVQDTDIQYTEEGDMTAHTWNAFLKLEPYRSHMKPGYSDVKMLLFSFFDDESDDEDTDDRKDIIDEGELSDAESEPSKDEHITVRLFKDDSQEAMDDYKNYATGRVPTHVSGMSYIIENLFDEPIRSQEPFRSQMTQILQRIDIYLQSIKMEKIT